MRCPPRSIRCRHGGYALAQTIPARRCSEAATSTPIQICKQSPALDLAERCCQSLRDVIAQLRICWLVKLHQRPQLVLQTELQVFQLAESDPSCLSFLYAFQRWRSVGSPRPSYPSDGRSRGARSLTGTNRVKTRCPVGWPELFSP